jgi:uncharacterized membrane protein YbhN (UPF0104 family)
VSFRTKVASLKIQRWLPGVIISGVAIYFILKVINMEGLELAFKSIQLPYLIAGLILYLISLVARAGAWRILLEKK